MTTNETNKNTNRSNKNFTNQGSGPDMIAYTIRSREDGGKSIWTPVGAAWAHKDGKGYNIECNAFPVDGRLTLRFQDQVSGSVQPGYDTEGVSPSEP